MTPVVIIDLRDYEFTTRAELESLLRERLDEVRREFGRCEIGQIVITPHHEKMLKLELAENFEFRWKNLKNKHLENIGGTPVVKLEWGEEIGCLGCGGLHEDDEEW